MVFLLFCTDLLFICVAIFNIICVCVYLGTYLFVVLCLVSTHWFISFSIFLLIACFSSSYFIFNIVLRMNCFFLFGRKSNISLYSILCWLQSLWYSLFSPCCGFLSRYVPIFSMANACIQPKHVRLHILKHIVLSMQMVSLLSVLIMSKANVFERHANIFIHQNILLLN